MEIKLIICKSSRTHKLIFASMIACIDELLTNFTYTLPLPLKVVKSYPHHSSRYTQHTTHHRHCTCRKHTGRYDTPWGYLSRFRSRICALWGNLDLQDSSKVLRISQSYLQYTSSAAKGVWITQKPPLLWRFKLNKRR